MKYLITIICILTIHALGCHDDLTINSNNIKAIKFILSTDNKVISKSISDSNRIQQIIAELNSAQRELAIFKAIYRLEIVYTDGKEQFVLCNGNRIKVNGLTYILNKSITQIIDEL